MLLKTQVNLLEVGQVEVEPVDIEQVAGVGEYSDYNPFHDLANELHDIFDEEHGVTLMTTTISIMRMKKILVKMRRS